MKRIILMLLAISLLWASTSFAGAIQYIGNGKGEPKVKITYSRSNGSTWEQKIIKPGQVFQVPRDATHLKIDNVPYNPSKNYRIKDGNVF